MFRLPVSYRVYRRSPDPKQSFKALAVRKIETLESWATRFYGKPWLPPAWPVHLHDVPREGIIRCVAYDAVRRYRRMTPHPRFDRVLLEYCGLVMGHADRYAVSEYVLRRLRDQVAEYRRNRWRRKKPLTRADLESAAMCILSDTARDIVRLAA